VVEPNQRAVVWRCGRILPELSAPGVHFGLPWGIDRVTRLKIHEQKRVGVGLSLDDRNLGRAVQPRGDECLAGDRNLIAVSAVVQYEILDAKAYLVRTADVPAAIEDLATAELSAAIATRAVDDILTVGRLEIQQQVLAAVRGRLAEWQREGQGLGVQLKRARRGRADSSGGRGLRRGNAGKGPRRGRPLPPHGSPARFRARADRPAADSGNA
jgi:membrane protease subunit HflK